jgi:uncharacterized membrane protein
MPITLAVHILSFGLVATGVIGGDVVDGAIRGALRRGAPQEAGAIAGMMLRLAVAAQVGAGLLILTGVGLLAEAHWARWGQGWLTVKLILVGVLILNGPLVARPAAVALRTALQAGKLDATAPPLRRLALFHIVQTSGLIGIVVLAVLKPF